MASRIILVEDGSRSGSSEENRPQDSVPKKLDEALKLLKSLDKSNSTEPTTKHAKFREVEEIWNKDSETYNVVTSTEPKSKPDESDAHIFLVHNRSEIYQRYIEIKSDLLRDVLRTILSQVWGFVSTEQEVSTGSSYEHVEAHFLYHHLLKLRKYRDDANKSTEETEALTHLGVLIDYIDSTYKPLAELCEAHTQSGQITFQLIPLLFQPDDIILAKCPGTDAPWALSLRQIQMPKNRTESKLTITGRYLNFDGERFGRSRREFSITRFYGAVPLISLPVYPLRLDPNGKHIREKLLHNGRTFTSLCSEYHVLEHNGVACLANDNKFDRTYVDSRIVVDAEAFRQNKPNHKIPTIDDLGSIRDDSGLTEEELVICCPRVLGFSLLDNEFYEFAVMNVKRIDWDLYSLDRLIIDEKDKEFITALCQGYVKKNSGDGMSTKDHGVLFLLHGPTGVGKTLTAEVMAESLQRSLYVIRAGNLRGDDFQKSLSKASRLASRWRAVVLFDDLDLFLQRHSSSLPRNWLECFTGLLCFTAKTLEECHEEVITRIDVRIEIPKPNQRVREKLWKMFLERSKHGVRDYPKEGITNLANIPLNGREIRNAMVVAQCLAESGDGRLEFPHLMKAAARVRKETSDRGLYN